MRQDVGTDDRLGSSQDESTLHIYQHELARTPPMGWNSWNIFHGDIDEQKIKGIVDKMVETGMRDAGYTYLENCGEGVASGESSRRGRICARSQCCVCDSLREE